MREDIGAACIAARILLETLPSPSAFGAGFQCSILPEFDTETPLVEDGGHRSRSGTSYHGDTLPLADGRSGN